MISLKKIVHSSLDNTIKYIFYGDDNLILEFSYINKRDGKDIICVPSQTMCPLGCKFCHTTDFINKIKIRGLNFMEIVNGVRYIYNDLKLSENPKTLLVSYMGCGEPILNVEHVVRSMVTIQREFKDIYVRFAIATSLPASAYHKFFEFVRDIDGLKLPVKLHVSLHYTVEQIRNEWMPNSLDIKSTIVAADFFKTRTGNPVEIHYALLSGINDTSMDAAVLTDLIKDKGFNVKFLFYNKKDSIHVVPSDLKKMDVFIKYFERYGISHEYYKPPGLDVGASCGQFLMDEYTDET